VTVARNPVSGNRVTRILNPDWVNQESESPHSIKDGTANHDQEENQFGLEEEAENIDKPADPRTL
jgi:hypothetical protein